MQYQLDYLRAMRFSPYYTDPDAAVPGTSLSQNDENKKGKKTGATTAESSSKVVSLKDVKLQKEVFPQEIWREFMEGETRRVERTGEGFIADALLRNAATESTSLTRSSHRPTTERRNKQKLGQDRLQSIIDQVEKVGSGGGGGAGAGTAQDLDAFDPGEEEDLGDYEDDMDDDYNLNYFDPGEDERDDLGDDAGGGDEGVYD